jgi:hypothetical protein
MSLSLRDIPGLEELLEADREFETATREDVWIGMTRIIAGHRVRVMTVQDYTALLQFESPLLNRRLPTPAELAFFLWALSPEIELWHDGKGWRGWPCLGWVEKLQAKRHGRKARGSWQLEELERAEAAWHAKAAMAKIPFELPDNAPFTIAVREAFAYIDEMFMDQPVSLKKGGRDTGLCYLTSWFDMIQSEYSLPSKEVWNMRLPVLFARIKAIQRRHNPKLPEFSVDRDRIMQNIMQGLRQKLYTIDDLRAGRVDLVANVLRQN